MKARSVALCCLFSLGIMASACDDEEESNVSDVDEQDVTDVAEDIADVEGDVEADIVDDAGDLVPDEQDQGEGAPTLALTGRVAIEETIDAESGSAYLALLVPEDFELIDAFDDPDLPAETLALFVLPVAAGYNGTDVIIDEESGLFREIDVESPTMMGDPWEDGVAGTYAVMFVFLMGSTPAYIELIDEIVVTELPAVVDVGITDLRGPGTPPATSCSFTQAIQYVDDNVDASEPCGADDGTCISGTLTFANPAITVSEGDVGEVYLFGSPSGPPLMIYAQETPPMVMPFKIPMIPARVTDACSELQIGCRLDVGGNNHGTAGGPEDPVLTPWVRVPITLEEGDQIDGIELFF